MCYCTFKFNPIQERPFGETVFYENISFSNTLHSSYGGNIKPFKRHFATGNKFIGST